jgi:hypothetical protein
MPMIQPKVLLPTYFDAETPPDVASMSPDALMTYASTRINNLDSQMRNRAPTSERRSGSSAAS